MRNKAMTVASAFCFLIAGCGEQASSPRLGVSGQIQETQKFTLQDLEGKSVSLEALLKQKKAVLLTFWATWCPPCREEIPDLIRLQNEYRGDSFTILGINAGESKEKVASFAAKHGINYPVVLDMDTSVAEAFHVLGIPTSLLINSEGQILGEYGAVTIEMIEDIKQSLLN